MKPIDGSDEQVNYRAEVLELLKRQTQALEFLRGVALFFTALFVIGTVVWIVTTLQNA